MLFGILGVHKLILQGLEGKFALASFALIFTYLCFAWSEWSYGGSLSMRAMVQSYPVFAIAMGAFYKDTIFSKKLYAWILFPIILLFFSYNLWLHKQAHKGGLLRPGFMTKAYLSKILFKNEIDTDAFKLLDTDEEFLKSRKNVKTVYFDDYETFGDSICVNLTPPSGKRALCMNKDKEFSPNILIPFENDQNGWIRISADFKIEHKEWTIWKMTQLIVRANDINKKDLKTRMIKIQRHLKHNQAKNLFIDFSIPHGTRSIETFLLNPGSDKTLMMDNLTIETFTE